MKSIVRPPIVDRTVFSLCPTCLKVINAHIFQEGDAVMIEKRCEEHGYFKDIYWSNVSLYRRFIGYCTDGFGIGGSSQTRQGCPFDCGICENHRTGTLLANIDVTDRCNLSCPTCFANAGDSKIEPTADQLRTMMNIVRNQKPVPCSAVQFSGGEPTMRDDLPEIVALARRLGFTQVQIATNGMKLATNPDLCRNLVRSGLTTVYLQFDGVTPEPYKTFRGSDLLQMKHRAIENLRRAKQKSTVLVPTLAKAGFDCVRPDMMFSSIDWKELDHIITKAQACGITSCIRVQSNPWVGGENNLQVTVDAARAFSIGVDVVQVSVASAAQVKALLEGAKDWHRSGAGWYPSSSEGFTQHLESVSREAMVLPTIESLTGLRDIEEPLFREFEVGSLPIIK